MIDAKSLLGTLLQSGVGSVAQKRVGHALGGGGLGGMADRALGEARSGSPLAVGGIGALAGAVLGGGRGDIVRGAVGGGALALLGKLAFDALRQHQSGGTTPAATAAQIPPVATAPTGWGTPPPLPEPSPAQEQASAQLLLRAMLSAAKADGQIDGNEMQRIMEKLDEAGADAESKGFMIDEMRRPPDVTALAQEARTPELAAQVYGASLLAIEVDTEAERDYLRRLAQALKLDAGTVQHLDTSLGAPT
jgi:uncharacterized membrane protein YebE (DUF533 family)